MISQNIGYGFKTHVEMEFGDALEHVLHLAVIDLRGADDGVGVHAWDLSRP